MFLAEFSISAYLNRIDSVGEVSPTFACLNAIMNAQLRNIPFENLDVQAGKIISIEPKDIYNKIVNQNRGGYCYEVNGIFSMALSAIGFEYQYVAARPMYYPVKRPKTHMAIIVKIDGNKYLCDLGFGSYGIRAPILIDEKRAIDGYEIVQGFDKYRLSKIENEHFLLEAWNGVEWLLQYSFDFYSPEWIDFAPANFLNSKHPDAIFVKTYLVILMTENGRKILFGDSLKIIENGITKQSNFQPEELDEILQSHFNIKRPMV